jgi:hypothetical protein
MTSEADTRARQLALSVHTHRDAVQLGHAVPVEVELRNLGHSALVVNARLGMGYPDSLDRDLYCEIVRDGQPYTDYQRYIVDYRRKPLGESSFQTLLPGQHVGAEFDLQYWYHLSGAGEYRVRVVYVPGQHASQPAAFSERVVSDELTVTVSA